MRSFFIVPGVVLLLLGVYLAAVPASEERLVLPILVYADDGMSEATTRVEIETSAPADSLYLRGHLMKYRLSYWAYKSGYDKKASVRINGGEWVDIDNENFRCRYPENRYISLTDSVSAGVNGCVDGPLPTIRGAIALEIPAGRSTLEFRFNGSERQLEGVQEGEEGFRDGPRSSGYRIIDLDVLAGDGESVLVTPVEEDDPSTWVPYYSDEEAILEGRRLWSDREATEGSFAACGDCHASDGRDLWYFNYENEAIVATAQKFGLTPEEGKKIASWIRSLEDFDETVYVPEGYTQADLGRPWNPPYQPGPGLRDKPVELWAAGAGLDWILESDQQMHEHMFPEGWTHEAIHPDSSLAIDVQPIALHLPDWNEWLPRVHPFDQWGGVTDNVLEEPQFKNYERAHEVLTENLEEQIREGRCTDASECSSRSGIRKTIHDLRYRYDSETVNGPEDDGLDYWDDRLYWSLGKIGWLQDLSVKLWTLHHRYRLEDRVEEVYDHGLAIRPRGWFMETMSLFRVASHMQTRPHYDTGGRITGPFPDRDMNFFQSTQWYELEMITGGDYKVGSRGAPMDWNYNDPHIEGPARTYDHAQAYRFWRSQIEAMQEHNNVCDWSESPPGRCNLQDYWSPEQVQFAEVISGSYSSNDTPRTHLNGVPLETRRRFAEVYARAWLEGMWRNYETYGDVPREEEHCGGSRQCFEDRDYVPTPGDAAFTIGGGNLHHKNKADNWFRGLFWMTELGVSESLVDSLAYLGNELWPNGEWELFLEEPASADIIPEAESSSGSPER